MKKTIKFISLVIAFAMIISTVAVAFSFSASAEENTVAYKFNPLDRHYGWGEAPKEGTYTTGGYLTFKDEGRYMRQHQLRFMPTKAEQKEAIDAMILAMDEYNGILDVDVTNYECRSSDTTMDKAGVDVACNIQVNIYYRYKDPDMYHPTINPDSYVTGEANINGWVGHNTTKTYKLAIDEVVDTLSYVDEGLYSDFEITAFQINVQNYASNAFTEGEYKGQAGLGFETVKVSPFFIDGASAPVEGEDMGLGFEFIPNEEDPKAAGHYIIGDYKYPQLGEDVAQKDGNTGGNGRDIDRSAGEFVGTFLPGDCNNDGAVNAKDTLLLRKYLAKWDVEINLKAADCNADGAVNAKDTLLLRKYLAKWDVKLG